MARVNIPPCPYCKRRPHLERCEPWSEKYGAQPWYVGCYQSGDDEHFIGANGDTRDEAIRNWIKAVALKEAEAGR